MNFLHLSVAICFVAMLVLIAKIIIDKINDSKIIETIKPDEFEEGESPKYDKEMIYKGEKVEVLKIIEQGRIAEILTIDGLMCHVWVDDLISIEEWEDEIQPNIVKVNYIPVPTNFNEINIKLTGSYQVTDLISESIDEPKEIVIDAGYSISNEDFVPADDNTNTNNNE